MKSVERAYRDSMKLEIPQIADMLQQNLGQRLTAYAVGLKDPRAIGKYVRGESEPRLGTESRLRGLFQITRVLLERETANTVRAWMIGANPMLNDRAPIDLLHERSEPPVVRTAKAERAPDEADDESSSDQFRPVMRAAEAFALSG